MKIAHLAVPGPPPLRLAYAETGAVGAPPVLFIHGIGGWHDQWRAQLPPLAAHFHCLAPSLRGHGPSEVTAGPFDLARFCDDLEQFLAARAIAGPVHVVAHSYGGIVGLELARRYPILVNKLVIMGLAEHMNFGAFFRIMTHFPVPHALLDVFRRLLFGTRLFAPVAVLRGMMRQGLLPWQGWHELHKLPNPVLLLAGQYDVVATPFAVRAFAQRFSHAHAVVVRDVRHKVQLQNAEVVNRRIMAFFGAR